MYKDFVEVLACSTDLWVDWWQLLQKKTYYQNLRSLELVDIKWKQQLTTMILRNKGLIELLPQEDETFNFQPPFFLSFWYDKKNSLDPLPDLIHTGCVIFSGIQIGRFWFCQIWLCLISSIKWYTLFKGISFLAGKHQISKKVNQTCN